MEEQNILPPYLDKNIQEAITFINDEEIWLPLNYNARPELKEIYYVSSHGRIFSNGNINFHDEKSKYLSYEISNTGYYRVHLVRKDNSAGHYSVHRLALEAFKPIEGMENLFVNHIDGNKLNDYLWNLEWTTPSENAQHAILNNFVHWRTGDDCSWSSIDSNKADMIASMIAKCNFSYTTICDILGCSKSVVTNIANGISWRESYEKYKLWRFRKPQRQIFTEDQYELLQKYIADNIHKYDKSSYRALCINACKDLFNLKLDRTLHIEIMDIIYRYIDSGLV